MATVKELFDSAWAFREARQWQRAEEIYRLVLGQLPQHASAWFYLGIVLHDQRRIRESIEAYRRALELRPAFASALNNLGNALRDNFQAEEADECYAAALQLRPDYAHALKNRGVLYAWDGDFERARGCYEAALKLDPEDAEAHRHLGLLDLRLGNFLSGWPEYEWRWRCPDLVRPSFSQPIWQGQSLEGKSILLYGEQGLGDTICYVRFAHLLKKNLEARTIVCCQPQLTALLSSCTGFDRLISSATEIDEPFDFHCSLLDVATKLISLPEQIPSTNSFVSASPELVNRWRSWFSHLPSGKRRVGLAWQGNRDYPSDHFRSIPLTVFEPLGELDSIQLVSLQIGSGSEQLNAWPGHRPIMRLPDDVDRSNGSFVDTAAILQQLDLIITVDTSVAHVAGALGRPTWLLLSLVPDWRWFLDKRDTPWYPSMKLFRQRSQGNWHEVVAQVVSELARLNRTEGATPDAMAILATNPKDGV